MVTLGRLSDPEGMKRYAPSPYRDRISMPAALLRITLANGMGRLGRRWEPGPTATSGRWLYRAAMSMRAGFFQLPEECRQLTSAVGMAPHGRQSVSAQMRL